ncbi:hypothetical protein PROFUN_05142 [Planoprotostelium fungivorum]|uniref:Uncharacterized protein n=1 Tax=Planoprotostelium fungivorum TaxID=1890364 RepID=A0A2P6NRR4_9EUKA|nr:hypothetical protein PROFUN_05142 [Planoprotostelium fungivorum]
MQSGLWSDEGPVPLRSVSVKSQVRDFLSEVQVFQKYHHTGASPLEATFKFPLDLFGALTGFSVTIDGKTVEAKISTRSKVQETSPLPKDYRHTEDEDEQPDLFNCAISVPPMKEVELELRYATELVVEHEAALRFIIPSAVLSPDGIEGTTHTLSIDIDVELPTDFTLNSPSHQLTTTPLGDRHMSLSLSKESNNLEPNFVLLFNMKPWRASTQPWSVVSHHPSGNNAAILAFMPQVESKEAEPCEIIFMVDCSNSMASSLNGVRDALQLFLRSLKPGVHFNLYTFSQDFTKMSPESVAYEQKTLDMAVQFVEKMEIAAGKTDLIRPLTDVFSAPSIRGVPRQLFVITDGNVHDTRGVCSLIRKNASKARVFSFGVGDRVGHHLVMEMARAGHGEYEFVSDREDFENKLVRQVKRSLHPALNDPHIKWEGIEGVVQTPEALYAVYNGDRLFVYALLPRDIPSEATATFSATSHDGQKISYTAKLNPASNGSSAISVLAARNRIRDLEEADEHGESKREEITRLGLTFGLASKFTSFSAVVREQPVTLESSIPLDVLKASLDKLAQQQQQSHNEMTPTKKNQSEVTSGATTPLNANSAAFVPRSVVTISSPKKTYSAEFILSLRNDYTGIPTHIHTDIPADIIVAPGSNRIDPSKAPKVGQTVSTTKARDNKPTHKREGSTGRAELKKSASGRNSLNASRENITLPPVAPLVQSENRWIRPEAVAVEDLTLDQIRRKVLGILNKMTLEKFIPLTEQLLDIGFDSIETIDMLIYEMFDKAAVEPHFSTMYATLCLTLSERIAPLKDDNGDVTKDFRKSLISKAQEEFTQRKEKMVGEEKEDAERLAKLRSLGTVRFIGELFKQGILAERTMHACIDLLLKEVTANKETSEEDYAWLVNFITTTGELLELPQQKLRDRIREIFERLSTITTDPTIPPRVKFMLMNLIDLRDNGWTPRRKGNEAKTLAEARADVEEASSSTPVRPKSQSTANTPVSPAPSKTKKESRDKLIKSTSAIPRNTKEVAADDDWETAPSSRKKSGRGGRESLHASSNGWETVGGSRGRGGRGGRGTPRGGGSRSNVREEPAEKKSAPAVRVNLFAALQDDDETASSPAPVSAMKGNRKGLARSDFVVSKEESVPLKKSVTIREPEPVAKKLDDSLRLIYEEFLSSEDKEEALQCIQELNLNAEGSSMAVQQAFRVALEGRDKDREQLVKLLLSFVEEETLTQDDLIDGFSLLAQNIEEDDMDYPLASNHLGLFIGRIVAANKLSLAFLKSALSSIVESGKAIKIALVVLKNVVKEQGEQETNELYKRSGLDLSRLVRKTDRDGSLLSDLLKKDSLDFLLSNEPSASAKDEELLSSTRPRRQSIVAQSAVDQFVLQQSAEGFWSLDQKFADLLNARLGDLQTSIPEEIKDSSSLWATLLALAFLEGNYGHKTGWELLSKKARSWVEGEVTRAGASRGQLQEDAQNCLKDLDLMA